MRLLVRTTKALADENRIRILGALGQQELCVCQVIELLGLAPSTVSKHLSILKNARLVDSRKQGRWMHYRIAEKDAPGPVTAALEWVFQSLDGTRQFAADRQRLEEILKIDPDILCGRQPRSGACDVSG